MYLHVCVCRLVRDTFKTFTAVEGSRLWLMALWWTQLTPSLATHCSRVVSEKISVNASKQAEVRRIRVRSTKEFFSHTPSLMLWRFWNTSHTKERQRERVHVCVCWEVTLDDYRCMKKLRVRKKLKSNHPANRRLVCCRFNHCTAWTQSQHTLTSLQKTVSINRWVIGQTWNLNVS